MLKKKRKKAAPKLPPGMGIAQGPPGVKSVSFQIETKPDHEKTVRQTREDLVKLRDDIAETARQRALHARDPDHAVTVVSLLQMSHRVDVVLMKMGISETLGGEIVKIDGKEVSRGKEAKGRKA